jgi:malonate transporter and related proteins
MATPIPANHATLDAHAVAAMVVTLVLGFFAAWHHQFSADQASVLNRMVMLYALPMSLFAGMVTTRRTELTSDLGLVVAIAGSMLAAQLATILVARFLLHRDLGFSALAGLAVGGTAAAFIGVSVLGYLFGAASAIPIAVAALVLNVIQVPVTLVLLSIAAAPTRQKPAPPAGKPAVAASAGATPTASAARAATVTAAPPGARNAAGPVSGGGLGLGRHLLAAVKEPVVWLPVAGLVVGLAGVDLPASLVASFKLLGAATGGVALFASGIILDAQRIMVNRAVAAIVAGRNLIVPGVLWAVLAAVGMSHALLREAVLTMAIPVASIVVILAVQYKQAQREMASSLFFSTVLSIVTLGVFIALT